MDENERQPIEPDRTFLTDRELARRRRQSVRSLQRQRKAGHAPPSIRVGRRNLTRLDWLLAHEVDELAKREGGE